MKKLFAVLVLALSASLSACGTCKLEREQVLQVEKNHAHIFPRYKAYVQADPKLDAGAKDDEIKLMETTDRAIQRLKKRTEE